MSEKRETDSIRFSQVLAGALAAVTAAVLGSTMGVAGTVIGAGLASAVTTVGGALYMRSIQRTKQGVRTVRDKVVARAGSTSVTLVEEERPAEAEAEAGVDAEADAGVDPDAEVAAEEGDEQPPAGRRMRWPALIAASVLAFMLGMIVVTGVEALRGEQLSGGTGTSIGGIVRSQSDGDDDRDNAPPATRESTTPNTGTAPATVTSTPPTGENEAPADPPSESTTPDTTAPDTTTDAPPTGSESVPKTG